MISILNSIYHLFQNTSSSSTSEVHPDWFQDALKRAKEKAKELQGGRLFHEFYVLLFLLLILFFMFLHVYFSQLISHLAKMSIKLNKVIEKYLVHNYLISKVPLQWFIKLPSNLDFFLLYK